MKKFVFVVLSMLLLASVATASMLIPSSDRAKERSAAPDHSPVISVTDSGEWELERVDFIHYAKPSVKPVKPTGSSTCYKLMGVKWKALPVSYVVNPANTYGLSEEFVMNTFATSAETWDDVTLAEIFSNTAGVDYSAQYGVQDYQNSVEFGEYGASNVIAVTSVWYTRVGKQIVEFDMLFNTAFAWGDATVDSSLMDFQNIATHELGHAVGLSDLYTDSCSAVTMYGYSNYGDVAKRTLEQPDVTGLQSMYGL
ncbi:MAG: matrixin family metalloprotease [archaeon]